MLDDAFEVLRKFDWGDDLAELAPIEEATLAARGNREASQDLENRLIAALSLEISRDAKDYVCRKLAVLGTAAAVPALAAHLGNKPHSHMARYALEQITATEAGNALRGALSRLSGNLQIGVISSLGARRDTAAVAALSGLLRDHDPAVSRASALALGAIGNAESATALQAALGAGSGDKRILSDALLTCAEALLAVDQRSAALSIYKSLAGAEQGRLVRLAATRGMLACAASQMNEPSDSAEN